MLVLDPTSSYLMFRHYLECICLINQSDEVVSVVQLHVTVVQSKGHGTVFTSEYCTGGQTVVGMPHALCDTRALYLVVLFEGTWYLEDIWMEQCNRLELELGEIVKCMGGTGCEGVCLNMHSIVHIHLWWVPWIVFHLRTSS